MGELVNDPEMIELAAKEMAMMRPGSIKDPIAYAESLQARFGLNYDGRTKARLRSIDLVTEMAVDKIPLEVDVEAMIPFNEVIIRTIGAVAKADITIRSAIRKATGNVKVK